MGRLLFDSEVPKICVPIVGQTEEEIIRAGEELHNSAADLIEWRADFFQELKEVEALHTVLGRLRSVLGETPLLFTIRTADEGGEIALSFAEYADILQNVAKTGMVDYIDVEMFWGYRTPEGGVNFPDAEVPEMTAADSCHAPVRNLVQDLQAHVDVIGSYHNFEKTPPASEMTKRLFVMRQMGASIPKMAVMPHTKQDVLQLMLATLSAKETLTDTPVITMSMGALGAISRVAGANFGSAVTFGCHGKPSAPGQLSLGQLQTMLETFRW